MLKEGDIISVGVEITNPTLSDTLKNFVYRVSGNNSKGYIASDAGIVTTNGQ